MFEETKDAEAYNMGVIEASGIDRDDLIRYALLAGSDYTPGVYGVGTVNATEILRAFPGPGGLQEFRDWMLSGAWSCWWPLGGPACGVVWCGVVWCGVYCGG